MITTPKRKHESDKKNQALHKKARYSTVKEPAATRRTKTSLAATQKALTAPAATKPARTPPTTTQPARTPPAVPVATRPIAILQVATLPVPPLAVTLPITTTPSATQPLPTLESFRGINMTPVPTEYKDKLLEFCGLSVGALIVSHSERHPTDFEHQEVAGLLEPTMRSVDPSLWDFGKALEVAIRLSKAPFMMVDGLARDAILVFIAFRHIRNLSYSRKFIVNCYWGALIYCSKRLAKLAIAYNPAATVPVGNDEDDWQRTPVTLVLQWVEETEQDTYSRMIEESVNKDIVSLDIKAELTSLYKMLFLAQIKIIREKSFNEAEYKIIFIKAQNSLDSYPLDDEIEKWPCLHISSYLLSLWPSMKKADEVFNISLSHNLRNSLEIYHELISHGKSPEWDDANFVLFGALNVLTMADSLGLRGSVRPRVKCIEENVIRLKMASSNAQCVETLET